VRSSAAMVRLVERGVGVAIVDPVASQLLDPGKVTSHRLLPAITWDIAQFVPRDRPLSAVGLAFAQAVSSEIDRLKRAGVVS